MAFTAMNEYGPGVYPECENAGGYVNCPDVSSYMPFDVSGLKSAIENSFTSTFDILSDDLKSTDEKLEGLKDCWGTKFINLSGNDLNIVDIEVFDEYFNSAKTELEDQKSFILEIVDNIVSKTESVKEYLQLLSDNYNKYLDVKSKYENAIKNYNNACSYYNNEASKTSPNGNTLAAYSSYIRSYKNEADSYKSVMDVYEQAKIDSPNGSWVLG